MKKILCLMLSCICTMLAITGMAFADSGWVCPSCGQINDASFNYCPRDATRKPSSPSSAGSGNYVSPDGGYTHYSSVWAVSNRRIATRTGPGTEYDEPGSFFQAGTNMKIVSKAYDSRNGIWWVQVEFTYQGSLYWAYTGVKRFDNLDLSQVPEEKVIGRCRTSMSLTGQYAPFEGAAAIRASVPAGVDCEIYGYVSGQYSDFIQIQFYDPYYGCYRRAWVKDPFVDDYEMYYGF